MLHTLPCCDMLGTMPYYTRYLCRHTCKYTDKKLFKGENSTFLYEYAGSECWNNPDVRENRCFRYVRHKDWKWGLERWLKNMYWSRGLAPFQVTHNSSRGSIPLASVGTCSNVQDTHTGLYSYLNIARVTIQRKGRWWQKGMSRMLVGCIHHTVDGAFHDGMGSMQINSLWVW